MDCLGLWRITKRTLALPAFSDRHDCHPRHNKSNKLTVVLDAVGVNEADIRQEHISVLIFVLRDILWIHLHAKGLSV